MTSNWSSSRRASSLDGDLQMPSITKDSADALEALNLPSVPAAQKQLDELSDFGGKNNHFDVNLYATKKSVANCFLDLALLMANASQLKHIILSEGKHRFYYIMMGLLLTSIVLQVLIAIALLILARSKVHEDNTNKKDKSETRRADQLNNVIVISIVILTVFNVFIAAFGLDENRPFPSTTVP